MKEPAMYRGIEKFREENRIRFCMPGHKGKKTGTFLDGILPYDVTELPSTDNLISPEGIIKKAEKTASDIYKSRFSLFSACGASPLVKAALFLAAKNSKILADRGSHISLFHGAVLSGTDIIWLYGDTSSDNIPLPPTAEEVEKKLSENKDIKAVFITSPNYYGVLAHAAEISRVCKKYGVTFIVDNSHGSHLAFIDGGKAHPNSVADIVIDSVHKTMPALTGAAILHINTVNFDKEEAKKAVLLFSSTSPSYPVMTSLDFAVCYCDENRDKFKEAVENVRKLKGILSEKNIFYFEKENTDPLRLTILTGKSGIDSKYVFDRLYERGIACEMADKYSLVLIITPYDTLEELLLVAKELDIIYNSSERVKEKKFIAEIPRLKTVLTPREALFAERESVFTENAAGRIIGETITAYPPCVPIAAEGELLTTEAVFAITKLSQREKITVIKEMGI